MSQRNAGNPSKYPSPKELAERDAKLKSDQLDAESIINRNSSSIDKFYRYASSIASGSPFPIPSRLTCVYIVAWLFVFIIAIRVEFGSVLVVLTSIVLIFTNVDSDDDNAKDATKMSAYSVFNRGAERMAGSMDGDAIDKQIRHQHSSSAVLDFDKLDSAPTAEHYTRPSKAANMKCVCGSGRKYKVCCSPLTASEKQEDKEWKEYSREWA